MNKIKYDDLMKNLGKSIEVSQSLFNHIESLGREIIAVHPYDGFYVVIYDLMEGCQGGYEIHTYETAISQYFLNENIII